MRAAADPSRSISSRRRCSGVRSRSDFRVLMGRRPPADRWGGSRTLYICSRGGSVPGVAGRTGVTYHPDMRLRAEPRERENLGLVSVTPCPDWPASVSRSQGDETTTASGIRATWLASRSMIWRRRCRSVSVGADFRVLINEYLRRVGAMVSAPSTSAAGSILLRWGRIGTLRCVRRRYSGGNC